MSSLYVPNVPLLSVRMMFFGLTPAAFNTQYVLVLAAPTPTMVNFASDSFLPTNLRALMVPARLMAAVPC